MSTIIKKNSNKIILVTICILFIIVSCNNRNSDLSKANLSAQNFIPMPLEVIPTNSGFPLNKSTVIHTSTTEGFEEVGNFLADKINHKTGLSLSVNSNNSEALKTIISINQSENLEINNPEAYQIKITKDSIILNAQTASGAFRGIQTIRQIIPYYKKVSKNKTWMIPTGQIVDAPQFEYRGAMLDVSRHFFSVDDVKKYIDMLSYYKFNVFHMHLSDDQGWRIEIKSWPKLTEIGGSTEVGGESGGFYTQEEYTEIVKYAAERHMIIVPEIDMPGHTNAASVSYPFLNGTDKTPELYEGIEVGFSTFDTSKDSVYAFIDDVIREITSLSPGPYFHIGGDESLVTKEEDYLYFINRVEKIVHKYGKRMVGWDEIAIADIDSTSVSQWWHSEENAQLALKKNMKLILSPAKKTYLDMKYDSLSVHGLSWAGFIPTDSAYIWKPETYLPKESILGIEAPLWSETISNIEELEYLAFPRVIGYAELGWTSPESRNWENYKIRLANQKQFLEFMKVKYYPSPLIDW